MFVEKNPVRQGGLMSTEFQTKQRQRARKMSDSCSISKREYDLCMALLDRGERSRTRGKQILGFVWILNLLSPLIRTFQYGLCVRNCLHLVIFTNTQKTSHVSFVLRLVRHRYLCFVQFTQKSEDR